MQKKTDVIKFEVLSRQLPELREENLGKRA
jgi:hypothetical protein